MQKKVGRGTLVGLAAAALTLALRAAGLFAPLEWKSWDARLRLLEHPSAASREIVLVLIDQASLDFYEKEQGVSWPWPRQLYSALTDFLRTGGAKAVFCDLILSETSSYGVEDDADFVRAMTRAGNVILPVFLSKTESMERGREAARSLGRFSLREERFPDNAIHPLRSVSLPVPAFLEAARAVGNVQFVTDGDAIYRRLPLVFSFEGLVLPSLPAAVVKFVRGESGIAGAPLDARGNLILKYHGPAGTYQGYSIAALINSWAQLESGQTPQVPPQEFAGKVVIVGGSAPGLLDQRASPFGGNYSGTEILATAVDNLLNRDFVRVPPFPVQAIVILFLAVLAGVGTTLLRKVWSLALFFAAVLVLPAAGAVAAFTAGSWLEFAAPLAAVILSFIGAALLNYSVEGRQRRFIKSAFRYYLSPDVIERILANPGLLRLGGERRTITAMFTDLAGFTSISEGLSPEELVALLNAYLSEMTDIVLENGGTLDKYEGDAIIAFWNAPLDQPDHAVRACRAALWCQARLAALRPELIAKYGHELRMRVGLSSGPAVVGNLGSRSRFDYTAMGDTMNLASRLEGACKVYRTGVLVGEETEAAVREAMVFREVDLLRVVGKRKPVRVFELIGETGGVGEPELARLRRFNEALGTYRAGGWEPAARIFRELSDDPVAGIYAERCAAFLASPPPADWDGVFELVRK